MREQIARALARFHGYTLGADLTGTTWLAQADALLAGPLREVVSCPGPRFDMHPRGREPRSG